MSLCQLAQNKNYADMLFYLMPLSCRSTVQIDKHGRSVSHLLILCRKAYHMVPHAVLLVQVDGGVISLDAAVQLLCISELARSLKLMSLLRVHLLHMQLYMDLQLQLSDTQHGRMDELSRTYNVKSFHLQSNARDA